MSGLNWYEHLYTDEKVQNKIDHIKWRLNHGAGSFKLYLITLSTSEKMQLDILPAYLIRQKALRNRLPMIIGVTSGYQQAEELVVKIVEEVYASTGSADLRRYFETADTEVN